MAVVGSIISNLPQRVQEWTIPFMPILDVHNNPSKIQLTRLGHVYFEHRDLKEIQRFAKDFGFIEERRIGNTIYYRGYDIDPYVYVVSQSETRSSRSSFCCKR